MGSSCSNLTDGKAVVDHIKLKKKDQMPSKVKHLIECECGETFVFEKVITNCPKCEMTYAATPCSSADINNIQRAGIRYA